MKIEEARKYILDDSTQKNFDIEKSIDQVN